MGPRHHLSFCACKTVWFALEWQVYTGSSTHLNFFQCKTATLWPDLQVCMGPSPHLWYLSMHNQRAFGSRITSLYGYKTSPVALCMHNSAFWNMNYKSLWVPALICGFVHWKPATLELEIACLYGSKTSPVILCMQNSVPSIRITSLYESQPSSVVFECKTAPSGPE